MPLKYFQWHRIDSPNIFSTSPRAALAFDAPVGIGVRHGVVYRYLRAAPDLFEGNECLCAHDRGVRIAGMIDVPEGGSICLDPRKSSKTYPVCDFSRVFLVPCFHHGALAAYVLDALSSFYIFRGKNAFAVDLAL